jgi:hypothetical protein
MRGLPSTRALSTNPQARIGELRRERPGQKNADNDPWDASTLEWATTSPPPNCNFVNQPVVSSRTPLWTDPALRTVVTGMRTDRREVLITGVTEAEPQFRTVLPGPTIWPLLTALGLGIGLCGSVFYFSSYFLASALALIGWWDGSGRTGLGRLSRDPGSLVSTAKNCFLCSNFGIQVYVTAIAWGAFCAATIHLYQRDWTATFVLLNTAALTAGGLRRLRRASLLRCAI